MLLTFLAVIRATVLLFVEALELLMFVRAIMSFIPDMGDNKFGYFVYSLTEIFISPVRNLLDRMGFSNGMFDMSFTVTYLLLILIGALL